jgi:hypothetical protein
VGKVSPLNTNSVLVLSADDSVTDEPLAVSVPLRDALAPSVILPKLSVAGDAVNCPAAAPSPDRAMLSRESDALERMVKVPEIEPEAVGENTTLNVRLCPTERITGNDSPLKVNAALDMLVPEIVALALPVFVRVSVSVCALPGRMLPKLRLGADAAIWPMVPAPESVSVATIIVLLAFHFFEPFALGMEALTATEPVSMPVADGVKVTFTFTLCPGERV